MTATQNSTTSSEKIGAGGSGGVIIGQSSAELVGFYGATTVVQPSTISTVDTTAVTTVQTAAITTAAATTNTTWQGVADADLRLHSLAINKLVADSSANAVAINTVISRLQTLGLIASS